MSDPQQVPVVNGTAAPCGSAKVDVKLELAFEYLMSKDRLQWVTITSPQVRTYPWVVGFISLISTLKTKPFISFKLCGLPILRSEIISFEQNGTSRRQARHHYTEYAKKKQTIYLKLLNV